MRSYAEAKLERAQCQRVVDGLKDKLPVGRENKPENDIVVQYADARSKLRTADTRMKSLGTELNDMRKSTRYTVNSFLDHGV